MKKLLVVLLTMGVTLGAAAQPKIGGGFRVGGVGVGGGHYVRPRVTVIAPYTYISPYYRLGYGLGYSPFYDPLYRYPGYQFRPSELDLQIEGIKNDFQYQISTVKHDKSLAKDDRKQKVRDLKHQREEAIIEVKKNYYKPKNNNEDSQS